jgi:hypothetical protein
MQCQLAKEATSMLELRWLVACLGYFLALMMKAVCSSEMLLNIYQAAQCYIPEASTLLFPVT